MTTMELELPEQSSEEWKSPLRKLARFFLGSRDRWKSKYVAIKKRCKELGSQVRAVEKSREKWKKDAKQAFQQVRQLQQELDDFKKSAA
jgi:hypothetical protein